MTLRRIVEVINNQLIITLPDSFKGKKKLRVIVDDSIETKKEKLALLMQAANDPLFLSDIKAINEDFGSIDHETL